MARLKNPENVLLGRRLQISAAPNAAPLVATHTVGKAPTFTSEHKDWPERPSQFTAYVGSANPKSMEALRWTATEENPIRAASVRTHDLEAHSQLSGVHGSQHNCAKRGAFGDSEEDGCEQRS